MKLQVLLCHTHTHQTNFKYAFLKSVFGHKLFIQVPSLESPFPVPEHTIALFSLKCVYFVSPGYTVYNYMLMWFHPEFDFKSICSSSVHKQSYMAIVWCGVPPLPTEHQCINNINL